MRGVGINVPDWHTGRIQELALEGCLVTDEPMTSERQNHDIKCGSIFFDGEETRLPLVPPRLSPPKEGVLKCSERDLLPGY